MSKKIKWGFATFILLIVGICAVLHQINAQTTVDAHIAASEKLITEGDYYDAILALKPLLTSDRKSEAQEEALWLAHTLTLKWEQVIIEDAVLVEDVDDKISIINTFGADFDNIEINWGYRYGFLHRLTETYPNTLKQPVAEYALIQSGYPVPQDIEVSLLALDAYIEKYEKTGRAEVYKAYLDIAHIHHGLWAAITFPDHPYVVMFGLFGSGDPEKDKELANSYREIALKYYAKFHINPYGLTDNFDNENFDFDDKNNYQLLKRKAEFGWDFILYGC